jgi:4-amino-4-deoxy-L-arabinose transferase-like glycosyltransferase
MFVGDAQRGVAMIRNLMRLPYLLHPFTSFVIISGMNTHTRPSPHAISVLVLALLAFGLSAMISRVVFERLPHLEDEVTYLFQAKIFARGEVVAPLFEPNQAYWQPFVIEHDGTRFGKYPPGWPALLGIGIGLGAAWWVNATMAALTVVLVYRLATDIYDHDTGLIASVLMTFSPMALLLNATFMSHTSALTFGLLFMWAYLRMTRDDGMQWGALAGFALGAMAANRPLSAVAIATPFVLWSGVRVLKAVLNKHAETFRTTLPALMTLSACAILVASSIFWFNWATTGNPSANLYTMVPGWEYDTVGFGETIGRNGHSLMKGVQFARYDLSVTAADLFGWQAGRWSPMQTRWVVGIAPEGMVADSYWPVIGLSLLILPLGIVIGLRRVWGYGWGLVGTVWVLKVVDYNYTNPEAWAAFGIGWALIGFAIVAWQNEERPVWTWLLFGVLFSIVAAHMAYWIGSQRYSTRYYFEAVGAAAILAAIPIAALAKRGEVGRSLAYGLLLVACVYSYTQYSVPRISGLRGFNRVTAEVFDGIEARRTGDAPVFVLITGVEGRWRTRGPLMTVSSPFLDNDIEFAYIEGEDPDARAQVLSRAVGRQVIEMGARLHDVWFMDTCMDTDGCDIVNQIDNPTLLTTRYGG